MVCVLLKCLKTLVWKYDKAINVWMHWNVECMWKTIRMHCPTHLCMMLFKKCKIKFSISSFITNYMYFCIEIGVWSYLCINTPTNPFTFIKIVILNIEMRFHSQPRTSQILRTNFTLIYWILCNPFFDMNKRIQILLPQIFCLYFYFIDDTQ